jgi:hypothetical protein
VSAHEDQDVARAELFQMSAEFFEQEDKCHVFCEAPLALQNGATTRLLCMAAAAVFCGFVQAGSPGYFYWTDPSTWKKSVLGRGSPPGGGKHKPWIRERCHELWPDVFNDELTREQFDFEPDLYDAWCLQVHGRRVVDS